MNRISCEEYIKLYKIDADFLYSLEEAGLLFFETEEDVKYIFYDDLPRVERLSHWHYELDVNIPGLEVIEDLLQKMENLRTENRRLAQELAFRTTSITDFFEDI